jgi:16S rRNA (guanine527-N7)-methyltransferase
MMPAGRMQIGSDQWCGLIAAGAAEMGITLAPEQASQFARHAQLLLTWNRRINLTAITDPEQMALKHYLDALAPLTHIPAEAHCLDIGTGGGFPGIPLKIMRPDQSMTLIDSIRKKISFIKEVIRSLALERIEALHVRAEELAQHEHHRHRYDIILSRAVSDVVTLVRLAGPLLAPHGRIIALKGPKPSDEPTPLNDPGFKADHHEYRLPISRDQRTLIVITRQDDGVA